MENGAEEGPCPAPESKELLSFPTKKRKGQEMRVKKEGARIYLYIYIYMCMGVHAQGHIQILASVLICPSTDIHDTQASVRMYTRGCKD